MKYRHYKGGIYEIVCEAKLEADPDVIMMVYKSEEGLIWTRPKEVFFETVQHEGPNRAALCPIELKPRPVDQLFITGFMVDFASLLVLAVLGLGFWFWLHSIRILEIAREAGRQACNRMDVQFLDDTVASTRLRLARDKNGRRILRRTYRFEFTETGNSRREGEVVMLGDRVESVTMEPYQILE